jgi:hypothetical protein
MGRARNALVIAVVMIITTSTLAADKGSDAYTMSFLNGRGWLSMPEEAKTGYLAGLFNGLRWVWMGQGEVTLKLFGNIYIPVGTLGETKKGLDMIYADPANSNMPVILALEVFKMRQDGKPQAEIEKQLEEARRFAHDAIEDRDRTKKH